jgi:ADP-dependent NAD(P)H-hydrate dehydratase
MLPPQPNPSCPLPTLPARRLDSHKGDYGRALLVVGSRGMSGAAVLAGTAALRGGAGLVRIAVPEHIAPVVAAGNPCYMTAPLPQADDGRFSAAAVAPLRELVNESDVVAAGPGLGRSAAITEIVRALVREVSGPLVLDADALNVLADHRDDLRNRNVPAVLTPHPGEFARLLGSDTASVQADRAALATRFAADFKSVVVLKGHGTVVADGTQVFINPTGNPGMASGGSGDVLTGLTAALLGQGLKPFAAAQLAVYLHGLAGDLARDRLGEVSLIATDILEQLPAAFRTWAG